MNAPDNATARDDPDPIPTAELAYASAAGNVPGPLLAVVAAMPAITVVPDCVQMAFFVISMARGRVDLTMFESSVLPLGLAALRVATGVLLSLAALRARRGGSVRLVSRWCLIHAAAVTVAVVFTMTYIAWLQGHGGFPVFEYLTQQSADAIGWSLPLLAAYVALRPFARPA